MGPSFVSEPVSVRVPATSANLGPGFDALGLALALYDEVTARVTAGGVPGRGDRRGRRELPTDERTWSCGPCGRPSTARRRSPPGWRAALRQPDPAGPRAGLLVGGDRGRDARWPGRWSPTAPAAGRRGGAALAAGSRATRTTSRPACWAASRSPGPRPTGARAVALAAGRRRPADGLRARGARAHRRGPGGAAGHRAARRRGVQRGPGRAAGARADRRSRAAAARPPRTGCTRLPGRRACRRPPRWSRGCVRPGWPAVVSGAGPSVLALTAGAGRLRIAGMAGRRSLFGCGRRPGRGSIGV